MTPRLYLELLALSAIWGGAFIYTRVLAPNIGVFVTTEWRLLLGGAGLGVWMLFTRFDANWRVYWKRYLALGLIITAGMIAGGVTVMAGLALLFSTSQSSTPRTNH